MATIFLQDDNISVRVPLGMTLREVAVRAGASMAFGCRVGDCTTCVAQVKSGMMFLGNRSEKELKALSMLGGDVSELRLMCQCRVQSEEGEIVISYGL